MRSNGTPFAPGSALRASLPAVNEERNLIARGKPMIGPRVLTLEEQYAMLEVEAVLRAARPFLGMAIVNSVGARADGALSRLDEARAATARGE